MEVKVMIDVTALTIEERQLVEARRAYMKAWRAKNPDKVKQHVKNFLMKQAQKYLSGTDTAISATDTAENWIQKIWT